MTTQGSAVLDLSIQLNGSPELFAAAERMKQLAQQAAVTQTKLNAFSADSGKAFKQIGQRFSGVGLQVQDIAVQLQGGTSVVRTLSQQLPQLASNFGLVGIAIGTAVGILTPFVARYIDLEAVMRTVKESVDDTAKAFQTATASQEEASKTVADLVQKYGEFAPAIQSVNDALADADRQKAFRAMAEMAGKLLSELSAEKIVVAGRALVAVSDEAGGLAKSLGVSTGEAEKLVASLREVKAGTNLEASIPVLQTIGEKLLLGDAAAQALGRSILEAVKNAAQFSTARDHADAFALSLGNLSSVAQNVVTWLKGQWTAGLDKGLEQSKARIEAYIPQLQKLQREREQMIKDRESYGGLWSEEEQRASDAAIAQIDKMIAAQNRNTAAEREAASAARERFREQQAAAKALADQTKQYAASLEAARTPIQAVTAELEEAQAKFASMGASLDPEHYQLAIQQLEALRAKMEELNNQNAAAQSAWNDFSAVIVKSMEAVPEQLSSGITDAFIAFADGSKSAKQAFGEFARDFIIQVEKMILQALLLKVLTAGMGMMFGDGGAFSGGKLLPFANGGTFAGGREIKPFATGGVVSSPVTFPMAGGKTGLMGEAGPEAIMPLTRRNGRLGVEGSPVNVKINNYTGAQVSARRDANGDINIDMLEREFGARIARGGSPLSKGLEAGYGLRRAGR